MSWLKELFSIEPPDTDVELARELEKMTDNQLIMKALAVLTYSDQIAPVELSEELERRSKS